MGFIKYVAFIETTKLRLHQISPFFVNTPSVNSDSTFQMLKNLNMIVKVNNPKMTYVLTIVVGLFTYLSQHVCQSLENGAESMLSNLHY